MFNDGKIQIFEWIHHQTPLMWSRNDEFLSICMGIAIRGDRQEDYAYLDPLGFIILFKLSENFLLK